MANVPDYCVDKVASHTVALILASLRIKPPKQMRDVYPKIAPGFQEPPDYSDRRTVRFLKRWAVLVTPHMAWYSGDSERATGVPV